jgi:hypothetical protein
MTKNEIIKQIAVYDGYTYIETVTDGYFVREEGHEDIFTYIDLEEYITDLNILHRVAVKVMHELIDSPCHDDISDLTDRCSNIQFALLKEPINGEYITLATATAEAILYLKKYKA